jgi:hypothetical protein
LTSELIKPVLLFMEVDMHKTSTICHITGVMLVLQFGITACNLALKSPQLVSIATSDVAGLVSTAAYSLTQTMVGTDLSLAESTVTPRANQLTPMACAYVWDIRSLPDATQQVQNALDEAGMENVKIVVEVYGESCMNTMDKSVTTFKALQTDFKVKTAAYDSKNREKIGDLAANLVKVLSGFPPDTFPGTQSGNVTIELQAGTTIETIRFRFRQASELVQKNIHGTALLDALR